MGSFPPNDDALEGPSDRTRSSALAAASDPPSAELRSPATDRLDSETGSSVEMIPVDDLDGLGGSILGLEEGQCVGNYRLERVIGQGSFAEVWLAVEEREHGFAKRVALKLMKAGARATAAELEAMRAEARLCGMLHHPRLVDVYAAGDVDGITYIAMEYVEGMTLYELHHQVRAAGLRFPLAVVLDIGIQLCEGLDYAHNAKDHEGEPLHLVHRDLKPGNIMVSRDGQVKIADFGLAKTTTSERSTKEGLLRGTPGFVAPEVWRGTREFRPPVDLFALGAILFEIAVGSPLFAGEIHAVIFRVVSGDIEEDMQQLRLHRPALAPVLKGLLERDREQRTQHAWEALEPLKALRRKADDPGGLKLFLSLFLAREEEGDGPGRLQVMPRTQDPDWHAVLGSVSLLSSGELIPLSSAPPEVPPTRSMEVALRSSRSSGKLIGPGAEVKPRPKPKPRPKARAKSVASKTGGRGQGWIWAVLGFAVFVVFVVFGVLAVIGEPTIEGSTTKRLVTVEDDLGSSGDDRGQAEGSDSPELSDERRLDPPVPTSPPGVKTPPRTFNQSSAGVQERRPPVEARKPVVSDSRPVLQDEKPLAQVRNPPIKDVAVAAKEPAIEKPVVAARVAVAVPHVPQVAPVLAKGCLVLKSNPGGLLVSLNGQDQGWSAGKRGREEEVDPGWYEVGMGGSPGEVEASVKVRVRGGERVEVRCVWGAQSSCKSIKLAGTCGEPT